MDTSTHQEQGTQSTDTLEIPALVPRLASSKETRKENAQLPQTLEALSTSSVCLITAATGSGKTTEVRQMILDDAIMDGRGALCNIICTQPRRIAATSVARTVARERGQDIGQEVGYEIRFEHRPPAANGGITYCTSGILLQPMRSRDLVDPKDGLLLTQSIRHVILDEIHDQIIDNHLLMMLLHRELDLRSKRARSPLSLILMYVYTHLFDPSSTLKADASTLFVLGKSPVT